MAVGTGGALHPAAGSTGQRSEGVGTDESGCRGWEEGEQEPEEESGGGGGAEAGGLAAPFVGDGGGLRSAVQPQSGRGQPSEQASGSVKKEIGKDWISAEYAKAPSWGDCEVAAERREPGNWGPAVRH